MRLFVAVVMLALPVAPLARAECLPSGRSTFAAGLDALNRRDLKTALARFEELVKEQPDCAEARNNLAVVLFEMGRPEEADKQLRQAVERNPDYARARANLRRVEGSLHAPATKPEVETALTGQPTVVPMQEPTAAPHATSSTPATPAAEPSTPVVAPNLATLEPHDATACLLDVARKQLCIFRRTAAGIVQDVCYPVLSTQASTWPQWVVASDLTAKRVRLVDERHQRRLRIVPDNVRMDDSVTIRRPDFEALAKTVTPWRTGWVVLGRDAPSLSATTAAQAAQQVDDALEHWRQAWEGKQFDAYAGFYGPSFLAQPEGDIPRWRARKQSLFRQSGAITVAVAPPSVFVLGDGSSVITVFDQSYRSTTLEAHDLKALRWQREGDRWLISVETTLAEKTGSARARRRRGG